MDKIKTLIEKAPAFSPDGSIKTGLLPLDFIELYRNNAPRVFYYFYSRVRNTADAEDLTSQTFISAFENLTRLRDSRKFTSWLFSIARHKASDFIRRDFRHPLDDFNEEFDFHKPSVGGLSQADRERLRELEQIISRLSPQEQEYLRLRIVAELPFAEIASILNEPETRLKKKYYRLLERLQAQVEK